MTEPDRSIIFRVVWQTDEGELRSNRAYRVQFNNAIGPYKGGLRFVKGLDFGTLKFLGFSQTFKNALTGLPMGGAKGGADFNPKGKSDLEVMRFCQSMMAELHRHIGEDIDVPAGDIGVGEREIAYLFGQYKRLANRFAGVLTGKGLSFGGSAGRVEATGYGTAYFAALMLKQGERRDRGQALHDLRLRQRLDLLRREADRARRDGRLALRLRRHDPRSRRHRPRQARVGQGAEARAHGPHLRVRGGVRRRLPRGRDALGHRADIALPCATENELEARTPKALLEGGCIAVVEGSNMPLSGEAQPAAARGALPDRPGEGRERRRRRRLRLRAEPERGPPADLRRRCRPAAARDDGADPRRVRRARRARRRLDRLRQGRQPGRLLARLRGDDRPGRGLRLAGLVTSRAPTQTAEREGFEPSRELAPPTRLAGECLQPLGHLSGHGPPLFNPGRRKGRL